MELALKNGFCELSFDEMEMVDGGIAPLLVFGLGIVAGYVVAVVVDGELKEHTGKTGAEWYQEWAYPTYIDGPRGSRSF